MPVLDAQVGLAACQIGKALGHAVVGTAGSAEGEQLVRDVGGADFVFNHKSKEYLNEMQVIADMFIACYGCSSIVLVFIN